MIVFGDTPRREVASDKLAAILALSTTAPEAGIRRHEALVAALIEAGELAQGLADEAFAGTGRDAQTPAVSASMALCVALARQVRRSWRHGFEAAGTADGEESRAALEALGQLALPVALDIRRPEGFAHYAVYPECYLDAAELVPGNRPAAVIGIRSIGTTLGAMVAASLPRASPPVTVRPVGPPFRRELGLEPAFSVALGSVPDGICVVADEGPGLSGSSFAAVASRLETEGVPLDRVHLLPSHGGEPGPEADPAIRRVWRLAHRHVRRFDDAVLGAPQPWRRLETWVSDLIGEPAAPLLDISGGQWRRVRDIDTEDWPPVHGWGERRKFLASTETGTWLLKFAGLDRIGRGLARHAEILAEAGFTPECAGLRHGFTVHRWRDDARVLNPGGWDRRGLVDRVAAYLALRCRAVPAEGGPGADPERILAMARANTVEALGEAAAASLDAWRPALERLARRVRPVATDNRLHAWEWIVVDDTLLKTDALDHHAGHDLIGCQDIAWDVAGAAVELSLSDSETTALAAAVEREGGYSVDPELLAFSRLGYTAFQLGLWTFAGASAADPAEADRIDKAVRRYRIELHGLVNCSLGDN